MALNLSDDQRYEIEDALSRALDHGVASHPDTRQKFAWLAMSHFLGGLMQMRAINASYASHFNTLIATYDSYSLREEVI